MRIEHEVEKEEHAELLLDEIQSRVAKVNGTTIISSTEPDGTETTDVKVGYSSSPTGAEKKDVEDILKKRGLKK